MEEEGSVLGGDCGRRMMRCWFVGRWVGGWAK